MDSLPRLLFDIGVPAAVIVCLVVWLLARDSHERVAAVAAVLMLVGILGFLVAQLYPAIRDAVRGDVELKIEPDTWQAFDASAAPLRVQVSAVAGERVIDERVFSAADPGRLLDRFLKIQRSSSNPRYDVFFQGNPVGHLGDEVLSSAGLLREPVPGTPTGGGSGLAAADHTRRVYLGKSVLLNKLDPDMKLAFLAITSEGSAAVSLSSTAYAPPRPPRVEIPNKAHEVQTFEGRYEYLVMVREADFRVAGQEWAAFSVLEMQ